MPPQNKSVTLDFSKAKPITLDFAKATPMNPDGVQSMASSGPTPISDPSFIGASPTPSMSERWEQWWKSPMSQGTLDTPSRTPEDKLKQVGQAAKESALTAAPFAPGVLGVLANLGYRGYGALAGAGAGGTLANKAGLPGVVGAVPGGLAGLFAPEIMGKIGSPAFRLLARVFGKEVAPLAEEAMSSGAKEMAGGTAGEAGAGMAGGQAGPSAGPKSASELSSVVSRTRAGQAPGSAASPIYTPESLASEQGMNTAALGKGGFNLTIPPEQQKIMDLVQRGKVPMGSTPRPPAGAFESLGRATPFEGAPPATPQPPSGTSPSFGEPEGALDAAIRGAAGQNPVIKSTDKAMSGEMPNLIKFMSRLSKYKRSLGQ